MKSSGVRDDHEVDLPVPRLRQLVGAAVILVAFGVLLGVVPFGPGLLGVALLLVGAGLLV